MWCGRASNPRIWLGTATSRTVGSGARDNLAAVHCGGRNILKRWRIIAGALSTDAWSDMLEQRGPGAPDEQICDPLPALWPVR